MKNKIIKVIGIILLVLAVIMVAWGIHVKLKDKAAIGIIGGADGPTAIFISKDADVDSEEMKEESAGKKWTPQEFTYLGNGEVTFKVCSKDGTSYTQKISFSVDEEKVNFVSEAIEDIGV